MHESNDSIKKNLNNFTPFKSTVLDDIENILKKSNKLNLHSIQIMVKEATQRCRDLNLPYEFQQEHIADEHGNFRNCIKIYDTLNNKTAEWPPTRLEVWLDHLREEQIITTDNIFESMDIHWIRNDEYNNDINDSLNSSKITLNMSAMKDTMLNASKQQSSTKTIRNQIENRILANSSTHRTQSKDHTNENMPPSSLNSHTKSPKSFNKLALKCVNDLNAPLLKLKRLCKNNTNEYVNQKILTNINEIECVIQEMEATIIPRINNDNI